MDHTHAADDADRYASFDERAATWDDDPAKVARAQQVAATIKDAVPLDQQTRLLEYGAGTGLVSEALRDAVGPLTLADTSAGMRAVMERKAGSGALRGARIWDIDLSSAPAPAGEQFDMVVTAMTLHHIADLEPVLAAFAGLLRPGGHLCIADLEEEDGSFHGEGFHGHHGFRRDELERLLVGAGFGDVSFRACGHVDRGGAPFPVFLATATRR
ncbi:MAG TPA: class I SAM-dependent methyltransferase [Acidimicrobiales bacterium]|nr:class I SAM-dependent methyltransferase [Acidimicrobiales bacterium]